MTNYRLIGEHAAAAAFGLVKTAGVYDTMVGGVRNFFSPANLRKTFIGDPQRAVQQLRDGTGFEPGGLFREALVPTGAVPRLFAWGMPAIGTAIALQSPEAVRGTITGSTIGSALGSTLGSPFGAVGMVGGGALGGAAGAAAGSVFNERPPRRDPPEQLNEEEDARLRGTTVPPYTGEVGTAQVP